MTQEYTKDSDPRTAENVLFSIPFGFSFFTAAPRRDIHIYVLKIVLQEYIYIIISFGVEQVPEGCVKE